MKRRKHYWVNNFRSGFKLGATGTPPTNKAENQQHAAAIDKKLSKEISLNSIAGPSVSPPFTNMVISWLDVVPNKVEGKLF